MNKILQNALLWTWCLPQSLLGFFYYLHFRKRILGKKNYNGISVYCIDTKAFGGISLGKFIFLSRKKDLEKRLIKHEYGHTIQGYIFGPLYILVIAIPSAVQFLISKYNKRFKKSYFKRFPENWANKLAGVK